jgi:uncharacterized repeat protein (TIGR01451 family)
MRHWLVSWFAVMQFVGIVAASDLPVSPQPPGVPLPPSVQIGPNVPTKALPLRPGDPVTAREAPSDLPAMPAAHPLPEKSAPSASHQAPQVSVQVIAPPTANVGKTMQHELVVRNLGQDAVHEVRVEEPLPPLTRYVGSEPRAVQKTNPLIWELGTLEGGAERRIRVELEARGEAELSLKAKVYFSTQIAATVRMTRPKLEVKINGPESALVGETVVFHITLSNTGTGPISRILLRDRLPAGLHHPAGEFLEAEVEGLGPGESRTVMLRTTAIKVGQYEHQIEALGDGQVTDVKRVSSLQENDLASSSKTSIRVVEPALALRVVAPKICLVKCESLLSVEVSNPGTAVARNIRVVTRVPEGTEFVAVDNGGRYDPASQTITWAYPALEPSGKRVWTMKVRGVALGATTCTVMAAAEPNLTAKADASISIEGVPALSLEVIDLDDPAPVDSDAQYEIRVLNQGTCPCTGIQIVAQLPDGMELREASAPTPYKVVGQQVQFAPYSKLATKADLVYRLKVRSKTAADVRFRVQLTCDQLQQPVFKEESSRFFRP